ncbi:tripartite motif-containing protein 16-like [Carassius carassius]|uniref:tripartite motif-containing protein 16-like n=1 Tax=Carassius carassius TaxID=217509 RepID=UPI0028689B81|nr:tripartite motif-containing protein 16-like [Carassius carassius]
MAESSVSLTRDEFNCPVCLNLLKDPVTVPCGHSYCMSCITDCWDQDDQKGVYSCPQCRQTFTPRPVLGKNTMLAEVVEKLKMTKLQTARPAQCYSGSGYVECDICTGDKNKAIKSCLVCLESYCQTHFERHEEFHSGKRHKLTDATGQLQEMICPLHDKLLEIFCRTDQQCICYLCMLDKHKNHETVSAAAERTEKQRQLGEMQRKYQERIQEKQKELEELKEAVESHKRSAQTAVEDSERIFTELIRSIERSRSEVTQLIRDQEKAEVSRAEGQLEQLVQEIEDLRRRDAELEQLSHTDNHIHFFQSFQSLSVPPASTNSPSITVSSRLSFDDISKYVFHLKEKLDNFCREEIKKISGRVTYIVVIPTSEPKTREDFLQYSHQLTLDLNTMNKNLCLSEENRVIEYTREEQLYPDHPDRFDGFAQVLCRESVCGRCYWEVEWSGSVYITVSYKRISRKGRGKECEFGCNDHSWSLYCSDSSWSIWHNNRWTALPVVSSSSRIGVYVDHSAGTLSFYSVSDTMTLIHRVQTTFTQPLYAGFEFSSLCKRVSNVTLCKL